MGRIVRLLGSFSFRCAVLIAVLIGISLLFLSLYQYLLSSPYIKLEQVIAYHHQPNLAGSFIMEAAIVHLADIFCRALDMGYGGDSKIPPLDRLAWESLKIQTNAIEPIMETMQKEYRDISSFIS